MPPAEPSPTPQPAPWRSTQFQLVDGVNRYRAGQQEVDGTIMLYGDVGGHMCSFAQLTDYSRETFRIDREILFIFNTGAHSISDETQLESFRLSINAPDAAVTLRLLQSTEPIPSRRTLTVPALDFSGSGTLNRSDFLSQLKKAIYPGTGQHRAGALCEEAVRLLAANPDRLLAFDQLRELVCLVTGNELLLLTPVSFLCPLHGRENPSSKKFLRSLLRRSHPCELDLGALRVLDVDVGDTGIVGDTNIRRLLDRLPPSVSLRPVRDNEWRGFSRTAAALRWSEDWYVDRISP